MTEIRKNVVYQALYQIVLAITPLITAPYIARVLGVENLGIYSYTYATVSYFILFSMLGITNYGSREIAISYVQGKENTSQTFCSIYLLQCLMTIVMICIYIVYVVLVVKDNRIIAATQIINLFSCLFDVNWFFVGIEKIKIMAKRGIIIKALTVLSILLFVKKESSLWIYVMIMSLSALLNNLVMWRDVLSDLVLGRPSIKSVLKHIKPCAILFLPVLSSSVYRIMDKTMVGNLSNYEQLGFYYNADKVINIPICLMSGISMIILPRMTNYLHNNEIEKSGSLFSQSIDTFFCVSCAIGFGIASVAEEFVPLFFGKNYFECIFLVKMFSPVFIIKSISMCVRNIYLIPAKKEMIYNFAIVGGVITNLVLNIILIPLYGAGGAVFATLATELVVCILQIIGLNKHIIRIVFRKQLMLYFINAISMSICVYYVKYFDCIDVEKLIIKILLGIIIYVLLCFFEWKNIDSEIFKKYISIIRWILKIK